MWKRRTRTGQSAPTISVVEGSAFDEGRKARERGPQRHHRVSPYVLPKHLPELNEQPGLRGFAALRFGRGLVTMGGHAPTENQPSAFCSAARRCTSVAVRCAQANVGLAAAKTAPATLCRGRNRDGNSNRTHKKGRRSDSSSRVRRQLIIVHKTAEEKTHGSSACRSACYHRPGMLGFTGSDDRSTLHQLLLVRISCRDVHAFSEQCLRSGAGLPAVLGQLLRSRWNI